MTNASKMILTLFFIFSQAVLCKTIAQSNLKSTDNYTIEESAQTVPLSPKEQFLEFSQFAASDASGDGGGKIRLWWELSSKSDLVDIIEICRREDGFIDWTLVGTTDGANTEYIDDSTEDGKLYNYKLRGLGNGVRFESEKLSSISSSQNWFASGKINLLIIALIVIGAVIFYIMRAGKKDMFIRRIAGLQAVEEAVGRATEMGRSVLFIPGIQDMDDVQTLAGLTILGSVAKLTAEYETTLDVPVARSLVMSNGREVVKEAFLSMGRPDMYHDDIVHYITDEQFGYVAAVDGIMVREKPAACFYMGAFFAESLILAETGNNVGAIQIAGTAMPTQLPFFVAACDYTLIGEELFAASAYLSGDQRMIASLRGQDVGKALAMISILFGSIFLTISSFTGSGFWSSLSTGVIRLFALNY